MYRLVSICKGDGGFVYKHGDWVVSKNEILRLADEAFMKTEMYEVRVEQVLDVTSDFFREM